MFLPSPAMTLGKSAWFRIAAILILLGFLASPGWTQPQASDQEDEAKENPSAQERPQPDQVSAFMRLKLKESQKVLEGLTVENFKMIEKSSHEMMLMSQASNWQVLQTRQYLERSREFRRATSELTESAARKNLEAAALAYMDVTLKCVECHKYVRRVRKEEANSK